MAKMHIKFLLFFTLQALGSGLAVLLQSMQLASRLQITAAMTGTGCNKTMCLQLRAWLCGQGSWASELCIFIRCLLLDIACCCEMRLCSCG